MTSVNAPSLPWPTASDAVVRLERASHGRRAPGQQFELMVT